jgi:hypothetical protein
MSQDTGKSRRETSRDSWGSVGLKMEGARRPNNLKRFGIARGDWTLSNTRYTREIRGDFQATGMLLSPLTSASVKPAEALSSFLNILSSYDLFGWRTVEDFTI